MRSGPGGVFKNLNPKVGITRYSTDTVINQHIPVPEPIIEEPIQEIKQEENELQRTQVEQTEIPSGGEDTRESSTGNKQDSPRKSRI